MRNRLTFANVIGVLLENKKKTYPQHQLVRSLFSAYLDDTLTASELIADDTTMYSRWCNGARPIPIDILKTYEDEDEWDTMEDDFRDKIIPNLLNEAQARIQMEELITDSIKTIGQEMADALIQEPDNAAFFCSVVRYAILNDHSTGALYSPDLSEVILCNKLPSCNQAFIGRKDEIKAIASHLSNQSVLFITGMAGIGKSEVAKAYDNAIKKYKKAIALMKNYHKTNAVDARSANLLSNLHNNLSTAYLFRKKREEAVTELKTAFAVRNEYASLGLIENNDTLQQTLSLANMLVQNKEYDSALEVIDFCESTIEEVIGTNNLDYGLCEFYRGVIAYTRSQPVIAEQHLLNADAVFHDVMNENPDNDYSKSTARYLYSLYMRWGRKELAEQYKKILISTH